MFSFYILLFLPATASQQEPEAEPNSDPSVKSNSPATQTLPSAAASISDKSNSPTYMDKSKDSAGVTVT